MLKINNILLFIGLLTLYYSCSEESPAPEIKVDSGKKQEKRAVSEKAPGPVVDDERPVKPAKPALDKDYLMGKFDPSKHPDFVAVKAPYTDRPGMILHRETFEAFKEMWKAAKKEGVELNIKSSTRNFQQQKAIWDSKWKKYAREKPDARARALKILEYSAMPGASRHHWGTDIDLNDLNNTSMEASTGKCMTGWQHMRTNTDSVSPTQRVGRPATRKRSGTGATFRSVRATQNGSGS